MNQKPFVHTNNSHLHSNNISMPKWALKKHEPGDLPFWCETCDRGFKTQYLLDNHKSQHEKCNIDGCQFIAHPKIITRHIQMQHSTGLFKKIAKLQDPEEIKKWREERKKRYPTKENIERKDAEQKEKIERGEKIGINSYNRHTKKSDSGLKRNFREPTNAKRNFPRTYKKPRRNQLPDLPIKEDSRVLKPFTGIQHLLLEDNDSVDEEETKDMDIIDDEWIENRDDEVIETTTKVCGALSALIGDYRSSDEDENEGTLALSNITVNSKTPIKVNQSEISTQVKTNKQSDNDSIQETILESVRSHMDSSEDDGPPEETTILKTNGDPIAESSQPHKSSELPKRAINKNKLNHKRPEMLKKKLPSTLLQKLLKSDIIHERNMILQCVHYVVNKKYFDKENK